MKDKEKQLTVVIEKVLRDTQNCDMSIETLTDYLVDRIKDKDIPEDSVVLSKEELNTIQANFFYSGIKCGSKETAEKIFRDICELNDNTRSDIMYIDIEELAKKYGVDI